MTDAHANLKPKRSHSPPLGFRRWWLLRVVFVFGIPRLSVDLEKKFERYFEGNCTLHIFTAMTSCAIVNRLRPLGYFI